MDAVIEGIVWVAFAWMVYFAFTAPGHAQVSYDTVRVQWDHATEREDGTTIGDPETDPDGEVLFYLIRQFEGENFNTMTAEHEVSADRTTHDIQILAGECYQFSALTAAAPGGQVCNPTQHYQLSHPSGRVTNCKEELNPNPPREFM